MVLINEALQSSEGECVVHTHQPAVCLTYIMQHNQRSQGSQSMRSSALKTLNVAQLPRCQTCCSDFSTNCRPTGIFDRLKGWSSKDKVSSERQLCGENGLVGVKRSELADKLKTMERKESLRPTLVSTEAREITPGTHNHLSTWTLSRSGHHQIFGSCSHSAGYYLHYEHFSPKPVVA